MFKIVTNNPSKSRETTLNDIPVGQVFRGTMFGPNSRQWVSGLFYKAESVWRSIEGASYDCLVVSLLDFEWTSEPRRNEYGYSNLWLRCTKVKDYEPVIATLTIEG